MRGVVEAEMRRVVKAEMEKGLEAEMRGIVEAENLSATLDSLSPMHAETEGNEPNPSVQLCKFKSKKYGRRIGHKYNTRRNWNVEMCNWGEMLPGPWHGGPSLEDTDTLVSWLPIRSEWAIYAPLSSWHSAKYIYRWLEIYSLLTRLDCTKHSAANLLCIRASLTTTWREAYPILPGVHLLIRTCRHWPEKIFSLQRTKESRLSARERDLKASYQRWSCERAGE